MYYQLIVVHLAKDVAVYPFVCDKDLKDVMPYLGKSYLINKDDDNDATMEHIVKTLVKDFDRYSWAIVTELPPAIGATEIDLPDVATYKHITEDVWVVEYGDEAWTLTTEANAINLCEFINGDKINK